MRVYLFLSRLYLSALYAIACLLICLVAPADTLAQPEATVQDVPVYRQVDCTYRTPAGFRSECGVLVVPEDRSNPDSALIELAVLRVESGGFYPEPDPVVYLVGGPGGNIVQRAASIFQTQFAPFARYRDIIFIDQRGTGLSQPRLFCREFNENFVALLTAPSPADEYEMRLDIINACSARLQAEGIQTEAYHSANSAADLADLRLAMGYDEWNLFGVSYGSRLALTIMRDAPAGLRSVILDSVYPPQVHLGLELFDNAERALDALFKTCASDSRCNLAYPDLEAVYDDLIHRLNDEPHIVTVSNPTYGRVELPIHGDRVFNWVFDWLYSVRDIPYIPHYIYSMAHGDFNEAVFAGLNNETNTLYLDMGMYYSVQCNEEMPFLQPGEFAPVLARYPQYAGLIERSPDMGDSVFSMCDFWTQADANTIENEPVISDVPTLVLAGYFDPITPPAWAEAAAETLSHHYYYMLPNVGHGVIRSSACAMRIAQDFIDNPDAEPDATCVAEAGRIRFSTFRR